MKGIARDLIEEKVNEAKFIYTLPAAKFFLKQFVSEGYNFCPISLLFIAIVEFIVGCWMLGRMVKM